jgi:hypothetical protein
MSALRQIIVDTTMVRVAETILQYADLVDQKKRPDLGTTETLRAIARSIIESTEGLSHDPQQRG